MNTSSQSIHIASESARSQERPSKPARPAWVPDALFPFTSRWLDVEGAHMHYVDEGKGHPILMVAGTPMWSFMYRHPIKALHDSFRCIAVDLPEFGLSEARLVADKAFGSC